MLQQVVLSVTWGGSVFDIASEESHVLDVLLFM